MTQWRTSQYLCPPGSNILVEERERQHASKQISNILGLGASAEQRKKRKIEIDSNVEVYKDVQ